MPTIDDVARAARVSRSTVSYVLSGKRPISLETRRRVEEAIRELGFRPHTGAQALASRRTHVIALMAPLRLGVDVGVVMQFVAEIVTTARDFGYDVLLSTTDDPEAADRVASGSLADALIMMDVESSDPRLPVFAGFPRPVVLIGVPADATGLTCVDLDFEGAARLGVQHLRELGHRRIALIGSPPVVIDRHTGFADRLQKGFLSAIDPSEQPPMIINAETTFEAAEDVVAAIARADPAPTALLVHNEALLPHLLAVLRREQVVVPADLSLVVVCPDNIATAQQIALTGIDIPAADIARTAVGMAIRALERTGPPEIRLLPPHLTVRSSTTAV